MYSSTDLLSFNIPSLLFVIAFTLGMIVYVVKGKENKQKYFLILVYFFLFIYCGIGGCLEEADKGYLPYYVIYMIVLTVVLKFFNGKYTFSTERSLRLSSYIEGHYNIFWILYIFLGLLQLVIPENRLHYLFSPPKADLSLHDFTDSGTETVMQQLVYLFRAVLVPFFYWSLYSMRKETGKIAIIMVFDLYVNFCANQYLARNNMLVALFIIFMPYYQKLSKMGKFFFFIVAALLIPTLMYFFYAYSLLRVGGDWSDVAFLDMSYANQVLIKQEISYPLLFDNYFDGPSGLLGQYFIWMILLPLPGFLKFGAGTMPLNRLFSTVVTGFMPGDRGFWVVLPGLVGESIFAFGPFLFVFHAAILGFILKYVMNTLSQVKSFDYLYYYFAIEFSFILGRAGTVAVYPHVAKSFVIFLLLLLLIKPQKTIDSVKSNIKTT